MRIALTADWHVRGKDLDAFSAQAGSMIEYLNDNPVEVVAIAGDIFDSAYIGDKHATTGAVAGAAIDVVSAFSCPVLMIPGNHDIPGVGGEHALRIFLRMENVTVCSLPGRIDIKEASFLCLPWQWSGNATETLTHVTTEYSRFDVLLGHVRTVGAWLNSIHQCEKADTWEVTQETLDSLPVGHIAFGDFHKRQDLGKGGYIGAFRQLNYGEEGNPAGFEIYDTVTQVIEWIELDAAPRYFTYDNDALLSDPDHPPQDHVRIRVTQDDGPEQIKYLESQGFTILHEIEREERTARPEIPEGVLQSPQELIKLWSTTQEFPPDRTDGILTALTSIGDSQ